MQRHDGEERRWGRGLRKFLLAKRSLRIQFEMEWNIDAFLKDALKMNQNDLGEVLIKLVTRRRTSARSRQYLKVLVTVFREEDTRS